MKLSSSLPKDLDQNGLGVIRRALLDAPADHHVVLALVDCSKTTVDHDTGQQVPTVRVLRIEAVIDTDREVLARTWMREAYQARTGSLELPFDLAPTRAEETPS